MKLKNMVTGTLVSTLLLLSGCGPGGDPLNVAEQFMDRYYVQANVQEAKALATPAIVPKIEEQFALFAQLVQAEKGKSHEASYTLVERNKEGKHAFYQYETIIKTKEAEPIWKQVTVSLSFIDGAWRITQFSDRAQSGPTQTVR